jgi:hypothetical protein
MIRCAICVVLIVPALVSGEPPSWHQVESKPGRYSVRFPGKPREHKGYVGGGDKSWYDTYTFSLHIDKVVYVVTATVPTEHLPKFMNINAYPGHERGELLSRVKKRKGKVLLDKASTSSRYKGYAVIIETPRRKYKYMTRAGMYVVGGVGYKIEVTGPSELVKGADVDRFFESFKVSK